MHSVTAIYDPLADEDPIERDGVRRDQYGRPLLIPPGGGPRQWYTSVSTLSDTLGDTFGLDRWDRRMIARGIGLSEELAARAACEPYNTGLGEPDKKEMKESGRRLDEIIEEARIIAKAHQKRDWGTAFHGATEPDNEPFVNPPKRMMPAVISFRERCKEYRVEIVATELFIVNEQFRAAGTLDHLVRIPGYEGLLIFDKKGLPLDTPLPTTTGWTTMGEVQVGDKLIGSDGLPATVTDKSVVHHKPCVRVSFDDGTSMVCDVDHRWPVRRKAGSPVQILTAGQLTRGMRIDMPDPMKLEEADLPVDPWALGAWLGNGKHTSGEVTSMDDFLWEEAERRGYPTAPSRVGLIHRADTRTFRGITKGLRQLGVLGNKHIPDVYLRASRDQREELLQGLMDTDGCWNSHRRHAIITLVDERLARQVHELALSLGQRARIWPVKYSGFGITGTAWTVTFTPRGGLEPFRLPRKRDAINVQSTAKSDRRLITKVEDVETVPTQCITVDSADQTYLCGRDMLVTHNTGVYHPEKCRIQLALYAGGEVYDKETDKRYSFMSLFGDPVNQEIGVTSHTPAVLDEGHTEFYMEPLGIGRRAAAAAVWVREYLKENNRARKQVLPKRVDDNGEVIA